MARTHELRLRLEAARMYMGLARDSLRTVIECLEDADKTYRRVEKYQRLEKPDSRLAQEYLPDTASLLELAHLLESAMEHPPKRKRKRKPKATNPNPPTGKHTSLIYRLKAWIFHLKRRQQ